VVTAPSHLQDPKIDQYIVQKSRWVLEKVDFYTDLLKNQPKVYINMDNASLQAKALQLVQKKVKRFNSKLAFKFKSINIKDQKTCWGSCSKKKNLNFNWRIALLPDNLANYIVVHELCHLKEFNHSRRYWNLVQSILPNYQELVKDLKSKGLMVN
jgi:predicted metal-dependent hydrolase